MKTVSVRIKADQAERLREIADCLPGEGNKSVDGLVKRAVDLWLEVEGPVYLEANREARNKLRVMRRHPVDIREAASH